MEKGKEHILCKKFAIRMWGRGSNTVCVRNLPLEGGEGEGTRFAWNNREGNPGNCNRDFQRVFGWECLGLSFTLELNLEEAG